MLVAWVITLIVCVAIVNWSTDDPKKYEGPWGYWKAFIVVLSGLFLIVSSIAIPIAILKGVLDKPNAVVEQRVARYEYKVGDVVRLRSGGPKMTIVEVSGSHTIVFGGDYSVMWYDEVGTVHTKNFKHLALEKVPSVLEKPISERKEK